MEQTWAVDSTVGLGLGSGPRQQHLCDFSPKCCDLDEQERQIFLFSIRIIIDTGLSLPKADSESPSSLFYYVWSLFSASLSYHYLA